MTPLKFTEIIDAYKETKSVQAAAKKLGVSYTVVVRTLVTHGIYPGERSKEVHRLLRLDLSVEEVAERMEISVKAVKAHLPYTKGAYRIGAKSEAAKRTQKCRDKKRAEGTAEQPRMPAT